MLRARCLVLACALAVVGMGVGQASASSSAAALVSQLEHDVGHAARAEAQHRALPAASYATIHQLARAAQAALPAASPGCRVALAAAKRLFGERRHRQPLMVDIARARNGLSKCQTEPKPKPTPPRPQVAAEIGGLVVNSAGHPLAGLAITIQATTSPLGPLYGEREFTTTTDTTGHFTVDENPALLHALAWNATATFPWYGGTWPRDLTTVSQSDPTHLEFRSDVASGAAGDTSTGVILRIGDWDGCDSLGHNPAFVASDPNTTSITVTLTPAGPLVDGSAGSPITATLASGQLCGFEGEGRQIENIPAGAWAVTGVSSGGRQLAFSTNNDGTGPYSAGLVVFNFPQSSSEALQQIDVHFAG